MLSLVTPLTSCARAATIVVLSLQGGFWKGGGRGCGEKSRMSHAM